MSILDEYYEGLGFPKGSWHVGGEHPYLERYAIRLLQGMARARVLEVGYQAGGFAVPVILTMRDRPGFSYVGIDSLAYENAVEGEVIVRYLHEQGVTGCYQFVTGDAGEFLSRVERQKFDLVLIDHHKSVYPRECRTLMKRELVSREGCILFHDVLGKARDAWKECIPIVRAWGYSWMIADEVPAGVAVVRRERRRDRLTLRQRGELAVVETKIALRQAREVIGRVRRWAAFRR